MRQLLDLQGEGDAGLQILRGEAEHEAAALVSALEPTFGGRDGVDRIDDELRRRRGIEHELPLLPAVAKGELRAAGPLLAVAEPDALALQQQIAVVRLV